MHTTEDIISRVSSHSELPKRVVRRVITSLIAVMAGLLSKGKGFRFARFGKFTPTVQKNKRGYNVYRGEHIVIPQTNRVRFNASRKLIDQMNPDNNDTDESSDNSCSESPDMDDIDRALSV